MNQPFYSGDKVAPLKNFSGPEGDALSKDMVYCVDVCFFYKPVGVWGIHLVGIKTTYNQGWRADGFRLVNRQPAQVAFDQKLKDL